MRESLIHQNWLLVYPPMSINGKEDFRCFQRNFNQWYSEQKYSWCSYTSHDFLMSENVTSKNVAIASIPVSDPYVMIFDKHFSTFTTCFNNIWIGIWEFDDLKTLILWMVTIDHLRILTINYLKPMGTDSKINPSLQILKCKNTLPHRCFWSSNFREF